MAVKDRHIEADSKIALQHIVIPIDSAISLTGAVVFSYLPGFAYRVVRVRSYCRVKAGVVTAQLKISTRAATAAVSAFTTATEVDSPLHATPANVVGSSTEALTLELTTDGSGVLTNGLITVAMRPQGLRGEGGV